MPTEANTPDTTPPPPAVPRVALIGNPNTGKTTLFNRLTGLRHKTSNFPGTTLEARVGRCTIDTAALDIIDLPGTYSLELDLIEARVVRDVLAGRAAPAGQSLEAPDGVIVVADATNLSRNLPLAGEALRRRLPTVVALNMTDLAAERGLAVDTDRLSNALGCPVIPICARSGENVSALTAAALQQITAGVAPTFTPPGDQQGLRAWADAAFAASVSAHRDVSPEAAERADARTDRVDHLVTHRVLGPVIFVAVMAVLFAAIFWLATFPMGWIEGIFSVGATWLKAHLPDGFVRDLLTDGVLAGVGATVVFVPQIAMLFFLIALLEDTGYLARAAFVIDRLLRPFGLPGHAFVPLLSSHACALPGIMATRCIPDPKERLATILAAPFMTCSARIPVYVLLTGLLFPNAPGKAALAFIGCYALGIIAGLLSVLLARRTILKGKARPMALELPSYKRPSLRTAFITAFDRSLVFLRKAGTTILAVSVILWWLGAFPRVGPSAEAIQLMESHRRRVDALNSTLTTVDFGRLSQGDFLVLHNELQTAAIEGRASALRAASLDARHAKAHSYLGRLGRFVEPALAPIGCDWQISIGVLSSFAARETFVGTMSIVIAGTDDSPRIRDELRAARRDDGSPVFSPATCWSLLVFYVLAMQCLPTLVVSARETGHAKWALLQLAWMSAVAYAGAWIAYRWSTTGWSRTSGTAVVEPWAPGAAPEVPLHPDLLHQGLPLNTWPFWTVTLAAVLALLFLLRNVLPIPWLSRRAKRAKQQSRATLTIGGKQIE